MDRDNQRANMTGKQDDTMALLARLAGEEYCYVTTTGRVSGRPHRIEIWFGLRDKTLYLLSGGGDKSDWVRNMRARPAVTVQLGEHTFAAQARIVGDEQEDALARRLVAGKYQEWREDRPFSEWARTALPVAIDLTIEGSSG
jgi:deazaflavin-dependent oxidoreductase (nitroreductase family)